MTVCFHFIDALEHLCYILTSNKRFYEEQNSGIIPSI